MILPGSDISFVTILGIFVMVYITLLSMEYITASLRIRMILSSLAIVIIPIVGGFPLPDYGFPEFCHRTLAGDAHICR